MCPKPLERLLTNGHRFMDVYMRHVVSSEKVTWSKDEIHQYALSMGIGPKGEVLGNALLADDGTVLQTPTDARKAIAREIKAALPEASYIEVALDEEMGQDLMFLVVNYEVRKDVGRPEYI